MKRKVRELLGILLGYRKFLVILLFIVVMITFRILGYINGEEFANNLQTAITAFIGANLGEHLVDLGKKWVDHKITLNSGEKKPDE